MAGSGGAIRAGGAFVELFANATNLQKGLKDAQAKVQNFGASIAGIGAKLASMGGAITAPLLGAAKLFADSGSNLLLMSQRTGMSVEALSTLGYVASQTGTDLESVETSIKRMNKSLLAGTQENMEAAESFAFLNLSVQKLMRLHPDERFRAVAKALAKWPDEGTRGAMAMKIMGRSGDQILPLIQNMEELSAEAENFGLVTSQEAAENAYKLQKAFTLLSAVTKKIITTVGSALGPILIEWGRYLAEGAVKVKEWIKAHQPMIVMAFKVGFAIAKVGAVLVAVGGIIAGIGSAIGVITGTISAIGAGFALLMSPIGLVIAGFTAMTGLMVYWGTASTKNVSMIGQAFQGLVTEVKTTFGGIADALKAGDIKLAGRILWAGLKVEFLKGLDYLKGLWYDWGTAVKDVFTNVKFAIAKVFINLGPNISKDFISVTGDIYDAFVWVTSQIKIIWGKVWNYLADLVDGFVKNVTMGFIDLVKEVKTHIAILKGATTGGMLGGSKEIVEINKNAEKAKADAEKAQITQKAARDKAQKKTEEGPGQEILANQEERKKRISGIEAGRVGALATAEQDRKNEIEARRKAAEEAMAGSKGQLTVAQKDLANLNLEARVAAAKGMQPVGMPLAKKKAGPDLSGLGFDRGFQVVKGSVAGSFSAGALGGLGAGETVQNDQLKEQKQINANLQGIGRKIDRNKLAFS